MGTVASWRESGKQANSVMVAGTQAMVAGTLAMVVGALATVVGMINCHL